MELTASSAARFPVHSTRFVGAGLALPSFHTADKIQGQGKPSPYETRKMFAKEVRIYGMAMPICFPESAVLFAGRALLTEN